MNNNTIKKIINYFEEHESIYNDCIEELDSYNGYLNGNRYYEMDMLNDFYSNAEPLEILRRAFFGRDENYYTTENGERIYAEFNPNRDYFTFNGYGNLISSDDKDYSNLLDEYVIESMNEHREYIYTIDEHEELKALFDELEQENDEQ